MKELSIEEKAQRYDEALKQIKECTPDENGFVTIYPQEIFPELAESEDERIRKEIIHYLEITCNQMTPNQDWDWKNRWLPWLERVGELEPKFRIGDSIKKKSTGDIVTVSEVDLKNREYRLSNTGFIPFKYECLWELVEQKPAEEYNITGIGSKNAQGKLGEMLKKLTDKVEQKSTWSEEDVKMIEILIGIFKVNYPNGFYKINPAGTITMQGIRSSEIIKWLKSLKERYTWKPSDEQMKALAEALSFAINCGEENAFDLRTLYEQLKKLREE